MKTKLIFLFVLFCFSRCSDKKETIAFTTLPPSAFNSAPFQLPVTVPDSLKHAHDSCMGFSFDVNAMFLNTKDTFGIGTIVNRQSLKKINTIESLGIGQAQLASQATLLTNPCYEKRVLQFPLKSLLGNGFSLSLPGASKEVNQEINNAIAASGNTEMSTGSWIYLDIRNALITISDTMQSEASQAFRQQLLDTGNMVLTATESVTDVGFLITTPQNMSQPLVNFLQSKPSVTARETQTSLSLHYISDNKFQLTLNGFFPVIGQFMKAELK